MSKSSPEMENYQEFLLKQLGEPEIPSGLSLILDGIFDKANLYTKYRIGPWIQMEMAILAAAKILATKTDKRQLAFCYAKEQALIEYWQFKLSEHQMGSDLQAKDFRTAMKFIETCFALLNNYDLRAVPAEINRREQVMQELSGLD